jgi:hypothetical protein
MTALALLMFVDFCRLIAELFQPSFLSCLPAESQAEHAPSICLYPI